MSRSSRAVPLLVAGVTGVLSGIYIFKPLFDQNSDNAPSRADVRPPTTPSDAGPYAVETAAEGQSTPASAPNSREAPGRASDGGTGK
ncbi:hypothetical protein VTO73DRAFT_389 [Trametes versicolor]